MKHLHLICNAHIDPVWMWNWQEGVSSALSTFYTAVELSYEFDYVFCHNEAYLYECIEKYDPALFARIKDLIQQGKWRVMGGWYIQPDSLIASGESYFRQIYLGKKYFTEKFNVFSSVAVGVDAFGHSRGLVQIIKKSGQDAYIIGRPYKDELPTEANPFVWRGYDGSAVSVFRIDGPGCYSSPMGHAKENILQKAKSCDDDEVMVFWGVGNHGGGPSRKDLKDIQELINRGEFTVEHSYPEKYFASVSPKTELGISLRKNCFIKNYSSMNRIKSAHTELENSLYRAEKMAALASSEKGKPFPTDRFDEIMRDMCFVEFHDILSGTCVEDGERSALHMIGHGIKLAQDIEFESFVALAEGFKKAGEGEYPIFIFNPRAYASEEIVPVEFLIQDAIVSDTEHYKMTAFSNGREIPVQVVKEQSNINYDRRKRVLMKVHLEPLSVTRVDLVTSVEKKREKGRLDGDIVVQDGYKTVTVSRESGLISSYKVDGKELLKGDMFTPYLFDDNADPWGLGLETVGKNMRKFDTATEGNPLFSGLDSCRVTEDGELVTVVESNFQKEGVSIRLVYELYKGVPYIDVKCHCFYHDKLKGVRLGISSEDAAVGQTVFGQEEITRDGVEQPLGRFIRFDSGLTVINNSTFSCMGDASSVYMTLLNGSCYCAHKIDDRPLIDYSRFILPIESGDHLFEYRVCVTDAQAENLATAFNQRPYALNYFPHGADGAPEKGAFDVGGEVTLISLRKEGEKYIARLFNNNGVPVKRTVTLFGADKELAFGRYEVKTVEIKDGVIKERELAV